MTRAPVSPATGIPVTSVITLTILSGLRCHGVPATDGHTGGLPLVPDLGCQHRGVSQLDRVVFQIT